MKCLGIDIGSFSVKVAEVNSSGTDYTITGYFEYPLSPNPQADRSLEVIEILRSLVAAYDPANTRFVIAMPQDDVSLRYKRFPFRERQKVLKSLAFELEEDIPLDVNDAIFDAKIAEVGNGFADVLTVAVPKEAVKKNLERAKDGGFQADILSVEGLALANIFENWNSPPPNAPVEISTRLVDGMAPPPPAMRTGKVILQMGHTHTLMLVYRDKSLVAARSILWGGAEMAEALAKTFSIPFAEGLKILQTKSFILMNSAGASSDQILLSNTISSSVNTLIREVKLSMLEIKSEFNIGFTQIDLMGGASQIQNLAPYLTQSLEIPANIYHHFSQHPSATVTPTPQVDATSAVAVGLAIEGIKRPRNPSVNLRKGEFALQNQSFKNFWDKWKYSVQVAAVAFALFFIYSVVRDGLAAGLVDKADQALAVQSKTIAGVPSAKVESYIKKQKTLIKNRDALAQLDNYNSVLDLLQKISDKMPAPSSHVVLNVQHFMVNGDDLMIEGHVDSVAHLAPIENALKQIASANTFKKINPSTRASGPGVPFAYQMRVGRED
jgi:general secretion pathway protein L